MRDAGVAVPAFECECEVATDAVEFCSEAHEFLDALRGFVYDEVNDVGVAESFSGGDGIGGMAGEVIKWIEDTGDAALGIDAV